MKQYPIYSHHLSNYIIRYLVETETNCVTLEWRNQFEIWVVNNHPHAYYTYIKVLHLYNESCIHQEWVDHTGTFAWLLASNFSCKQAATFRRALFCFTYSFFLFVSVVCLSNATSTNAESCSRDARGCCSRNNQHIGRWWLDLNVWLICCRDGISSLCLQCSWVGRRGWDLINLWPARTEWYHFGRLSVSYLPDVSLHPMPHPDPGNLPETHKYLRKLVLNF